MKTVILLAVLVLGTAGAALATSVVVPGTADIYEAGGGSAGGGTSPIAITLPSNSLTATFASTGTVVLNLGTGSNYNDPDGVGAAVSSSSNTGTSTISGLTAPNAGYLVGVFVAAGGPSGAAPAALNYATTSFTSFSPLLDQVFFIGDGLTGDGTGTTQIFNVPVGAATLYLGISDAGFYNGAPGAYGDNGGSFTTTYAITTAGTNAAPEPSSFVLFGGGLLLAAILQRKFAQGSAAVSE